LNGQGLQFNLNPAAGMSQQAIDAFQEAADILSAMFSDDIIVNINIDFKTLSSGSLGQSTFILQSNYYSEIRTALLNDQTSGSDNTATNFLPTGSSLGVYINLTQNNPNGPGSITPYLDNDSDANNYRMRITTANAKALGLRAPDYSSTDATITFSNQYTWDFDRSDGITYGAFDFVGIAIHEIGHAMGFTSGVDYLDSNPGQWDYTYTQINPLDLYRFSNGSISVGADIDWTADTRTKFFSIDGGTTNLATFSTGVDYGDGRQASHWKDHLNLGIMDPTAAPGEFLDITSVDIIAWDVIGWDVSLEDVNVQSLPYSQDFSSGLPGASEGWEYYSDNDGRIQVIGGRLRMDDSVGDGTYSLNEGILHVDLTGQTDVNLSLDHYSIYDESHAMPANFTGHYKADGIAVSIDGLNWIKVSDLTGSSHISINLDLFSLFGGSADLSDVRIKFQQYDNYPSTTSDDGREFDNIQITAISSGIVVQSIPYSQDFASGLPTGTHGWEYYSTNDGRIQVIGGRLRMDDAIGDDTFSLNEAILHVDLTDKSNVTLTFDHFDLSDEVHVIPVSFVGHYKGDGISLSVDGVHWVRINYFAGSYTDRSYALDTIIAQAQIDAGSMDLSDVRIKFQQYDNYPTPSDGREIDNVRVTAVSLGIVVQSIPYSQDFNSGLPDASGGWEYYSDNDGRIQIVGGRLRMDDTTGDDTFSLNEAILHVDLTGKTNVTLTFDHFDLGDEVHVIPTSFVGHYKGDGISLSVDGIHWVRINYFVGSYTDRSYALDSIIAQAKIDASSMDLSDVRIKFQQYDNYPTPSDGREIDNVRVTAVSSGITAQSIPYSQDFESGLPTGTQGWEYYSTNDGRIQVVGGRLRMDDTTGDDTYSLNEAILHVNLTGQTNVTLTFDHFDLGDEVHIIPASFIGHYKGDGISLSVDGVHWVRINYFAGSYIDRSYSLDAIIAQAQIDAGSTDLSNVRIKFQQYDNYPTLSDGREIDNVRITTSS